MIQNVCLDILLGVDYMKHTRAILSCRSEEMDLEMIPVEPNEESVKKFVLSEQYH